MPNTPSPRRELGFLISDAARLLRTYTDQRAREFGATRAQWAVLNRLQRHQGLSQNELACILDVQPITLTRLVDRLCDDGLVERRPDDADRRLKRLFLTEKAYPVLDSLGHVGAEIMNVALEGLDDATVAALVGHLGRVKDNLKERLQNGAPDQTNLADLKTGS